ncbi:MAG: ribose 5-phosphate isomerase A, partial [Melioribacteraceae bacterium]
LGIPISTLNKYPIIDITIDGADEVDEEMNLIKGGGGALLREKIIAQASKKLIIVIDPNKRSKKLGEKFFVPVEVLQFAEEVEKRFLESLGAVVTRRLNSDGKDFITDEKNIILDCKFGILENPEKIASILNERAGIVEHGIFINLADEIVTGE